jgi:hypothetical protein
MLSRPTYASCKYILGRILSLSIVFKKTLEIMKRKTKAILTEAASAAKVMHVERKIFLYIVKIVKLVQIYSYLFEDVLQGFINL